MSSLTTTPSVIVSPIPKTISCASVLNLVNFYMKDMSHRVDVLQRGLETIDNDPFIYVVTKIKWRDINDERPLLVQIPLLLSFLETLRGTDSVPMEIHLGTCDGFIAYLQTRKRVSALPQKLKECVKLLFNMTEYYVTKTYADAWVVYSWFWRATKRKGYNQRMIADYISQAQQSTEAPHVRKAKNHVRRFKEIMNEYFSIRFKINSSDSMIMLEE
jgi:hypothetical protein